MAIKRYKEFKKEGAAATVILNDKGQALVLKRGHDAPWEPNKWNLPGGIIEDGETPEKAAKREAVEECGLVVTKLHKLGRFEKEDWTVDMFVSKGYTGTFKTDYESQDHAWIVKSDIKDYDFVDFVVDALNLAFEFHRADI